MISPRLKAQAGLIAATAVLIVAMSIVIGGAFQKPTVYTGLTGSPATPFWLADLNGHYVSLASMRGSVVVLCFAPTPDAHPSAEETRRLRELSQEYSAESDVKVVAIYSNTEALSYESTHRLKARAADAGNSCLTLLDPTASIAGSYAIEERPTFLIIDAQGVIRYRGGIDDDSIDAPLASVSFPALIDLLREEKSLGRAAAPGAVLSNIK